jgi:heterotetrameric sarcosine oxidase gamma subunit
VSENRLQPLSGLNLDEFLKERWQGFSMAEITGQQYYWLAAIASEHEKLDKACKKLLGCNLPKMGAFNEASVKSKTGWMAGIGQNQWFVSTSVNLDENAFGKAVALTDQSDGWVGMHCTGEMTRSLFEKLFTIDLDASIFPQGAAARTPMEGMHCLILCKNTETPLFGLYFQRSSARSFVEHIRHAAYSTCGERTEIYK